MQCFGLGLLIRLVFNTTFVDQNPDQQHKSLIRVLFNICFVDQELCSTLWGGGSITICVFPIKSVPVVDQNFDQHDFR